MALEKRAANDVDPMEPAMTVAPEGTLAKFHLKRQHVASSDTT